MLMAFCLTFPQNDNLGEIRSLSRSLTLESFETADQEDLVVGPPAQSKGIVVASCVDLSHLGIHPLQDSAPSPSQPFSFEQKISILRC